MNWYHLAAKDLLLQSRDRRALVILLLLPLMFVTLLGMTTGQFLTESKDQSQLRIAVVDDSQSDESTALVATLARHEWIQLTSAANDDEATRWLRQRAAMAVLRIGPELAARVDALEMPDILASTKGRLADGPATLDLHVRSLPAFAGTASIAAWLIYSDAIRTFTPDVAAKNRLARRWIPPNTEASSPERGPTIMHTRHRPQNAVYSILVPGFTVMFVFFIVNIMARSFIQERELGMLRRLQLAPLCPADILLGKTVPFLLLSMIQTVIMFGCGRLLFGMTWGPSPVWLLPVMLSTSVAAVSLGLLVATIVKTDQQVSSVGNAVVLVLGVLSGCFLPREWLPDAMQWLSLIAPQAWARLAYDAVISGDQIDHRSVLGCCAVLWGFACVCFAIGCRRFANLAG